MSGQKNEQIMIGRAKNALLSFFEQRLSVPKIYLDADWQGEKVDLLAIDRAGVGDVTIARLAQNASATSVDPADFFIDAAKKLRPIPAHFKYLYAISENATSWETKPGGEVLAKTLSDFPLLYAPDGVGRIGHILIDFRGERASISVPISAERFRSNQQIYDLADSFAASHTADFEVRP